MKKKYTLHFTCDTGKGKVEFTAESNLEAEKFVKESYKHHKDRVLTGKDLTIKIDQHENETRDSGKD